MDKLNPSRTVYGAAFLTCALVPLALIGYKLFVLDYPLARLIPAVSYRVDLSMRVDGHGDDIALSAYLPVTDSRQFISEEQNTSGVFQFAVQPTAANRIATWKGEALHGPHTAVYSFSVEGKHIRYDIAPDVPLPEAWPPELAHEIEATDGIQVNDPLVEQTLRTILPSEPIGALDALTRIHRFLQDRLRNRNFSGFTDAVTALKLGEASCNGKSRAFVAMARKLHFPARLVGGLILEQGAKRVSHQWAEVYVNGHWVPFDTINDHFAEIPANYLTLYYGDLVLFKHTTNVNFHYFFKMTKRLVPQREAVETLRATRWNVLNVYPVFERVGISQNLLKIILMLPIGALVTVICRNVVGVETFGTFLPALIAAAARETGLLWGAVGFALIILIAAAVRHGLDRIQLLHSPKMAIMMTVVVMLMLSTTVLAVDRGLFEFAHITLFPIAILAITAERFALIDTEKGFLAAAKILVVTLIVVAACYVVMDSLFLQSLFLAFPELLLAVIALNLWLGKWMGLRVLEFVRFHRLIFRAPP
ncbi:MAG: 7TM domain-containing protein [Nitrospiria bacterium]